MSSNTSIRSRVSPGFTLVELLTVLAIIGILAAILIPVVGKVRAAGRKSACTSNVRQLAIAHMMCRQENKGVFPSRLSEDPRWIIRGGNIDNFGRLLPYLGLDQTFDNPGSLGATPSVLLCPDYQRGEDLEHTSVSPGASSVMAGYQLNIYANVPAYPGYDEYRNAEVPSQRVIVADLAHWWDGSLDGIILNGRKPHNGSGFNVGTWSGSVRWIKTVDGVAFAGGRQAAGTPASGGRSQWEGLDVH